MHGGRLMCPWCGRWQAATAYTRLLLPTDFIKQVTLIYKCNGQEGCKQLFALDPSPDAEELRTRVIELEKLLEEKTAS